MIRNASFIRGFTLIELLVVIAIIGVLSSIVLASLGSARTKGIDGSVKTNLANARAQAELFYDANNSDFSGVCGAAAVNGVKPIRTFVDAAASAGGYTASYLFATAEISTSVACQANATSWAIQAPLKTGGYWCVDYRGTSKAEAAVLAASQGICA